MAIQITDYTTIDTPYDANSLWRVVPPEDNGSVQQPAKGDGGALSDIWIRNFIRSENWSPRTKGFNIDGLTGKAEFMDVFVSGDIQALTGTIGGWSISSSAIYYDGTTDALSSGMAPADYPFYAGKKYADRATAPYRVTPAGIVYATGAVIDGTSTIGGRVASTLASAINSSGNLITNIINAQLDSSSKKILSDFDFGTTDYAGAVKTGDITWNTTTGAITGGSGVVVYRSGIIGASAGVVTFSIDAITGSSTFSGSITGSVITGGTIQTSASGERVEIRSDTKRINLINSSGNTVLSLKYGTTGQYIINCDAQNDDRGIMKVTASSAVTKDLFDVVNNGTGSTMVLYQDNVSNVSPVLELTNNQGNASVLKIIQTPTSSLSSIDIDHRSDSSPAINIDSSSSDDSGIEINAIPVNTNTHGILVTIGTASSGDGLNISNVADSNVSRAIEVTRSSNSTSDCQALRIIPSNAGTGFCWGITIADGANAKGIDLSALGTKNHLKVANDATGAGAYAGRIPIQVGADIKYIHYYDSV